MNYGHASRVANFIHTNEDALIGQLVDGVSATGISSHRSTQIEAWHKEIRLLQAELTSARFQDWFILLEYEIPRRSHRPDVILLSATTIFVIEFKVGARIYDAGSCWQVNSYARDLRDFHAESHGRPIVPILCATSAERIPSQEPRLDDFEAEVSNLIRTNGSDFAAWLTNRENLGDSVALGPIIPECWLNSSYRPTPTIIEAAVQLYEGHGVRELSHRYAHNLDQTTDMLVQEIEEACRYGRRVICFVTGFPGAGKTLTGLDVIHSPDLRRSKSHTGIFLSGNGPLVKIVREALVKSQTDQGRSKHDCEHEVTTFIQNVHRFLRFHRENPETRPHENVVVFDEAQRAWDSFQMERKQAVAASEATLLFDVMERLPDWAVIIALVGGGQEIFLGEAGLEEWGRALENRSLPWRVTAAPEVRIGGDSVSGHRLFNSGVPANVAYREDQRAHLDVVVRSHRAQRWAEWVNEFLSGHWSVARSIFPDTLEFPCFVTRDLERARDWLRAQHTLHPEQRSGLVATSKDIRLRAYGIERASGFLMNYPFEKWFLEPATDTRSSFALEVAASEFECQGLELDWVGICWGGDLTPSADQSDWDYRKFRGAIWQNVRQDAERAYTLNRYRVLLTRARRGLVIWVPRGDARDLTRDLERFERVFIVLRKAGVLLLEDHFNGSEDKKQPSDM